MLPEGTDPDRAHAAVDAAVGVLWALTGRRYGITTTIARPAPHYERGVCSSWTIPLLYGGKWYAASTPSDAEHRHAVRLPGPVHRVVGVAVDGDKLNPDEYRPEGDRVLRVDGQWPEQDLNAPLGAPGTCTVTYERGLPAPPGAATAVGALAAQFVLSVTDPRRCTLPRHTQQVTRQGVSVQMMDPLDVIREGGTGLPEVDLWVRAHNPTRQAAPSRVWSPDVGVPQ